MYRLYCYPVPWGVGVMGPAWLPVVLDMLVLLALVTVTIAGLFLGMIGATELLADGFSAVVRRTRNRSTDDAPDVTLDPDQQ